MPLFPAQTMLLQAASFEQMTGDNMRPMFDLKSHLCSGTATDYTQKPPVQGWNCFLTATGQFRLAQFYQNGNVLAAVARLSQVAAAATNVQNVVATANADAQAIGKALQANPAIPVDPILVANFTRHGCCCHGECVIENINKYGDCGSGHGTDNTCFANHDDQIGEELRQCSRPIC